MEVRVEGRQEIQKVKMKETGVDRDVGREGREEW